MKQINTVLLPAVEAKLRKTKAGQEAEALALELATLDATAKAYVMLAYEPGTGFESDEWLATHVQGHQRTWNVPQLQEILTRGQFKRVIDIKVNRTKLDELVRSGAVTEEDIAEAFEEKPNAPYVLITPRANGNAAAAEADNLAEALGL